MRGYFVGQIHLYMYADSFSRDVAHFIWVISSHSENISMQYFAIFHSCKDEKKKYFSFFFGQYIDRASGYT